MQAYVRTAFLRVLVYNVLTHTYVRGSEWQVIHETTSDVWGSRRTPPVRCSSMPLVYSRYTRDGQCQSNHLSSSIHTQQKLSKLHCAVHLRRFSHAAAVLHDQVVITHGFFYDVEARAAQWLSDTWSMSILSPYTWKKLHSGCSILLQSSLVCTQTICSCKRVNVCNRWRRCSCRSQGI